MIRRKSTWGWRVPVPDGRIRHLQTTLVRLRRRIAFLHPAQGSYDLVAFDAHRCVTLPGRGSGYDAIVSVMSLLVMAAETRGWTCVKPPHHGVMRFVTSVHGRQVKIKIRVYMDEYGDEGGWTLQVHVATPDPGLPAFRITREGFLSFIAGVFGGQDLQMGVPNFDYEYRVQSAEPDELRRVWTTDRCQFLLDHVPNAVARGTHEAVELEVSRNSFEESTIDRAVELAVELARSEVYGVAALRALPGAVYREGSGRGPHVELKGPSPIVIGPVRTSGRVVTRATMQGFLPVPSPATARLGAATLAQDGDHVRVTWPGIESSSQRLIAAIELLRTLQLAPHDGVYR